MKTVMTLVAALLLAGSVSAQRAESNQPRSGRQDTEAQTPPVKQDANTKAKAQNGASQNNAGQNATGDNPNRNEDHAIGNKNDNLMQMDTARGTRPRAPHNKTPEAIQKAATPEGATNNTSTPNSMNATPTTPDASNSYNRTSNGGIGEDKMQNSSTFHYMDKPNPNLPSSKGGVSTQPGGLNTTTRPARGEANTGGSTSTNATGQTKAGTTGTGYSTGANAGENSGNTSSGNNSDNRTQTTRPEPTGKGKTKRDTIR